MHVQETTFYEELQKCEGLDLRDNRGLVHELAYVLVLFTIALFRGRDGNMSKIHRSMKNKHKDLYNSLSVDYCKSHKIISRSYLPVFLEKIDGYVFSNLLQKFYGVELTENEKKMVWRRW